MPRKPSGAEMQNISVRVPAETKELIVAALWDLRARELGTPVHPQDVNPSEVLRAHFEEWIEQYLFEFNLTRQQLLDRYHQAKLDGLLADVAEIQTLRERSDRRQNVQRSGAPVTVPDATD